MNRILINLPTTIECPTIKLVMPTAGYGERLHAAIIDEYSDYVQYLNWTKVMPSVESVEEDCRKHHAEFILRDCIRYLIINKQDESVLGRCAYPPMQANWLIPQFGISYFIRASERGKEYATEAAHALAVLAFNVLNAKKVEIYCDADNVASNKVPIKLGFKLEYSQRGGWPRPDNKLAHLQTYSIFSIKDLKGK